MRVHRIQYRGGLTLAALLLSTPVVSAQTPLGGVISDATTGPLQSGVVYHATGNLSVPTGATLTVQQGAIVKFPAFTQFEVRGHLDVQGTAAQPVIFTDVNDDTAGGDTNMNQSTTTPTAGWWSGLVMQGTATGTVRHVDVRYGGSAFFGVFLNGAQATFEDCSVRDNRGAGWRFGPSTTGSTLLRCHAERCQGAAFDLVPINAVPGIVNPTAVDCFPKAVRVTAGLVTSNLSLGPDNGIDGVILVSALLLNVSSGATLTLEAGTIVKREAFGTTFVDGTLISNGTASEPVYFTSVHDDSLGGDTMGDGLATGPAPGDFRRIEFRDGADSSVLTHTHWRYSGEAFSSAVLLQDADAALVDCSISFSAGAGLRAVGDPRPTLTRLDVRDVAGYPITDIRVEALPGLLDCTSTNCLFEAPNVAPPGGSVVDEFITLGPRNGFGGVLRIGSNIVVDGAGRLTIEAGTILKFGPGLALLADGPLHCAGSGAQPVWFTSETDDDRGGDSNNDGQLTAPTAGDWIGLNLRSGSAGSDLHHTRIFHGGQIRAVQVQDSISMSDCIVSGSLGAGIDMSFSNAPCSIQRCIIRDCADNAIDRVFLNRVADFLDCHAEGNGFDRMELEGSVGGNVLSEDVTIGVRNCLDGQLYSNGNLTVGLGFTLTLLEGVTIKVSQGRQITVNGELVVLGTAERPVTLTDERDDSVGGDLNADGNATSPAPGWWRQLSFGNFSRGELEHLIVRYAGGSSNPSIHTTEATVPPLSSAAVSFYGVRVDYGANDGILLDSLPLRFDRITAFRNGRASVVARGSGPLTVPMRQATFVENNAIWGATANDRFEITEMIAWNNGLSPFGVGTVSYSNWPGGFGTGNIIADPGFVDLANGDLRTTIHSVGFDRGDPASPLDADGTRADHGAYPASVCWVRPVCAQPVLGGCVPRIGHSGTVPALSSELPFRVTLDGVPTQSFAVLFYGPISPTGGTMTPFGNLCTTPAITRTMVVPSGGSPLWNPCSGSFSFDLNEWFRNGNDTMTAPGDNLIAQYWFRDGASATGSKFSGALWFPICP